MIEISCRVFRFSSDVEATSFDLFLEERSDVVSILIARAEYEPPFAFFIISPKTGIDVRAVVDIELHWLFRLILDGRGDAFDRSAVERRDFDGHGYAHLGLESLKRIAQMVAGLSIGNCKASQQATYQSY